MNTVTQALKAAHKDLYRLDGLKASGDFGNVPVDSDICIDVTKTINLIEQALAVSERSLSERIEAAYDQAVRHRERMLDRREMLAERESEVKQENIDEWISAKTGEVRAALLASWLRDEPAYQNASRDYEEARTTYRLQLLEIERLKLLVELAKSGR